jgi:hypothetical protein
MGDSFRLKGTFRIVKEVGDMHTEICLQSVYIKDGSEGDQKAAFVRLLSPLRRMDQC